MLVGLLTLTLSACRNVDRPMLESTIEKVLMCTQASDNWINGRHPGSCRVQLANGDRLTLRAPVAEGDVVRYRKQRGELRVY